MIYKEDTYQFRLLKYIAFKKDWLVVIIGKTTRVCLKFISRIIVIIKNYSLKLFTYVWNALSENIKTSEHAQLVEGWP